MKKGAIFILGLLVLAQFIQPKKNQVEDKEQYFAQLQKDLKISNEAHQVMKVACYDCHSNSTDYNLWYRSITPVNFWMNHHIAEGKEHFNFSELNEYSLEKRNHKLEEFIEEVEEDKMPMKAYTITHGDARLTAKQKTLIIDWAKNSMK